MIARPSDPQPTATGLRQRFLDDEPLAHTRPPLKSRKTPPVPLTLDSVLSSPVIPGPEIEWNPSYNTFCARVARLAKEPIERPQSVPDGFPKQVDKPWCWDGQEMRNEGKWTLQLNKYDIREVEKALHHFKGQPGSLGPGDVSVTTFPLPGLQNRLKQVAHALHKGIGFSVIRGLEPTKYSARDNILIYLGITSYIAAKRGVQDSGGSMIIHVKDLGNQIPHSEMRQSPYARNAQPFHNDVCDILAMYVQEQAAEGGESHLASAAKIYNEIAMKRPDVIHTLAKPDWVFDKHKTPAYWNTRALLFNYEGKGPGFCFSRRPITGSPTSPRSPGVPPMTEIQAEAIDMIQFTGVKHMLSMRLQRGDIQLINNVAVFHARDGFRDTTTQKRHIIRLWLRNEELAWKTPEGLHRTWFEKYGNSERRKIAKWNVATGATRERVLHRSDSCS